MAAQKYKVATFTDFGDPHRKHCITRHKTFASAARQYGRLWQIYGRLHKYRIWQEEITE